MIDDFRYNDYGLFGLWTDQGVYFDNRRTPDPQLIWTALFICIKLSKKMH
jgi:hypothetical protein